MPFTNKTCKGGWLLPTTESTVAMNERRPSGLHMHTPEAALEFSLLLSDNTLLHGSLSVSSNEGSDSVCGVMKTSRSSWSCAAWPAGKVPGLPV